MINKRELLAGLAVGSGVAALGTTAWAQAPAATPQLRKGLPNRMAKTTKLFKAPGFYPNGLAVSPEGLWIQQQQLTQGEAEGAGARWLGKIQEALWLVDWSGKLLHTVMANSFNGSGLAFGDGKLWSVSNTSDDTTGIFEIDRATGKQLSKRQLPMSPGNITGPVHGAQWENGKLWIASLRARAMIRIDAKSWVPDLLVPSIILPDWPRYHDMTVDKDGTLLQVLANGATKATDSKAALVRYSPKTGQPIETITLVDGSCDPHGLEVHDGRIIACDAGYHPGWKDKESDSSGWIFSVDLI